MNKLQALACAGMFSLGVVFVPSAWAKDALQPMPEPPLSDKASPEALQQTLQEAASEAEKPGPETKAPVEAAVKLTPEERLDKLFSELLKTSNEVKARRIAAQISGIWAQSGSATVDLLLGWSYDAMSQKKYAVAIDFLDEAVALAPENAESWNRRAALHVLNSEYNRAIYDINRALELEPRHFGALTGLAGILQERGHKASALKVYERILTLYPMMREAQRQVQSLSEELSDIHT
ncbi:tetratricopeptide (TPR) repeat protein [Paenochrobactrum gallinarii]|uniref:Tetratricopeptide (TPR) repeat protein n=2 Tax=Paenochrobactrum gallinarii TaxID=643673 RepID=A0A841LXR3_9HYPH|nr:2-hydroxy-6-oxo-2,4-heptadienoate hydrolase [Paenochrobactrum gallinarii]MBB6261297.1 tetratricopeptide (TPR) repeat protein [Paenochrobactrum gallinarii]